MDFKKWNLYLGWFAFAIATVVYFLTLEDTVSLWDCGEYITAAYKLEVGHPPGAPLFMVIGRLFSFFAAPEDVAVWINRLSALSSSLTILFMFWSISIFVKKMVLQTKKTLATSDVIAILGSALVGSLAYTFSDSFWFSAVEGEVYAMSSLFTAVIFWAILKWDEEMAEVQTGLLNVTVSPNRWLLLIMFLLGLAIGVHLLGILVVPAIGFLIYFRYTEKISIKGFVLTGIISVFVLGFIQEVVIPGSISMASSFEVGLVNAFGMPFFSGTFLFFGILIGGCIYLIRYARKNQKAILYNAVMGFIFLLIGYGSFAVIVIRSNANPPLDENDPENLVTLHAYLKREQYGSAPLLTGPYWNSKENDGSMYDSRSAFYLRRFVVSKGGNELKAFKKEEDAKKYAAANGATYEEKYFESNANDRKNAVPTYAQTTFFPRMYWSMEQQRIDGYKNWSGYDATEKKGTDLGKDGMRLPTFGENMTYFINYQVNWMYWRYFMWNFAGRQNDIQGHGDQMRGNWLSGFSFIDHARLGNLDEAPFYTKENPSYNKFFFLPLIFGLLGLIFHFYKAPKDAFVLLLAFLFTGLAIVVYLNQKPFEPRERDYAYAGSFFFFAFWIGIGVYALYHAFMNFTKVHFKKALITAAGGLFLFLLFDITSETGLFKTLSWLIISIASFALLGLMVVLRKALGANQGAVIAVVLGLTAPLIMGSQGWDDHDRSLKTSAHDLAYNYLNSCEANAILFTNGDNDTFPLWYMQEVEGQRTDVRVCNLSLMQTDWYTEQMKMRAYESDPLPIKFREDQTLMYAGITDQVLFSNLFELFYLNTNDQTISDILKMRIRSNKNEILAALTNFHTNAARHLNSLSTENDNLKGRIDQLRTALTSQTQSSLEKEIALKYRSGLELFSALQNGVVKLAEQDASEFQKLLMDFDKTWDYTNLADAMAFVRDDKNIILFNGRNLRIFPSTGFILPVNADHAIASKVITKAEKSACLDELRFSFEARAISREQVMMLDILTNNDWKRGIYFSSPGGSDVSMALYKKGYIKQNGLAFVLSPLNNMSNRLDNDRMYHHLMNVYHYGEMKNPKVLTDYYARRHTSQFRLHFATLADDYLNRSSQDAQTIAQINQNVSILRSMGRNKEADDLEKSKPKASNAAENKKKAIALIKKSLQEMPADLVLDYGEPTPSREVYNSEGGQVQGYQDGILHDYVSILFKAGDKKSANDLGLQVLNQLNMTLRFFETSNPTLAADKGNISDLTAALDGVLKLLVLSSDPIEGDPKGALAKKAKEMADRFYQKSLPQMYKGIEAKANDNGESTRRSGRLGYYATLLYRLKDLAEGIGSHYGYLAGSGGQMPTNSGGDMSLEDLMRQMPTQDSVNQ